MVHNGNGNSPLLTRTKEVSASGKRAGRREEAEFGGRGACMRMTGVGKSSQWQREYELQQQE